MKVIKTCPFCGCERVVIDHEDDYQYYYHCPECEYDFSDEDAEHETLRQKVSAICSREHATEDNPINCVRDDAMELHIEGIDEAAQGLSESEKPMVTSILQDQEGIVWITVEYYDEPIELDDILTDSIREILHWLENEI